MWALIKWLVARLAVIRWLFKTLGGLAFLLPLALLLKTIGLPVLAVLGVLLFPVLIVLFLFGLPVFLVLVAGGVIMSFVFALLSFGLVVLKLAVTVVLPIWLVWKLASWVSGRGREWKRRRPRDDGGESGSSPTPPSPSTPVAPPSEEAHASPEPPIP